MERPPVPSTPPSKGRILSLKKCYKKVSKSLKGLQLSPNSNSNEKEKKGQIEGASSSVVPLTQPEEEEQNNSLTAFYENMEFFSGDNNTQTLRFEEEDEEEDSSKWTLSGSAPTSSIEGPPLSVDPVPAASASTKIIPGRPRPHPRPPSSPPPVPHYPSTESSDESFASCTSNPGGLEEEGNVKPLRSSTWGISIQEVPDGDATDEESDPQHSLGPTETFPTTARPDTGPGEEIYENVQCLIAPPPPQVHAVINVPPRVLSVIRERRRRKSTEDVSHHRSARLSRLLQFDLKYNSGKSAESGRGLKGDASLAPPPNGGGSPPHHVNLPKRIKFRRWVQVGGRGRSLSVEGGRSSSSRSTCGLEGFLDPSTGANEFEELRRLVKQGGDFCKDLSIVLHERSELESQYAKGLSKLSGKLLKASKEAKGSVAHAWQAVAVQIDSQAELHRQLSSALEDELAKALRSSTETQHKIRKSVEVLVEKTTRNLADWRTAEAKAKRHCFSSSKEFDKMVQDKDKEQAGVLQSNNRLNSATPNQTNNNMERTRSRLLSVPPTDKDPIKLESKRRKAEEGVRRADVDYYTFCIRSERARLEWESAIRNGSTCLRTLEEEKLSLLKELAEKYLGALKELAPKIVGSIEALEEPVMGASVELDVSAISDIRRHIGAEQLLPDFYAEDTSNLMGRSRRAEVLSKCHHLIRTDLEREKRGAVGVESLAKAIAEGPKIDNAHHDIADKLYYLRSMLLYLEASKAKVDNAMSDLEGKERSPHPITQYMRYQRDKQGLPQTILKVPSWAREDCLTFSNSGSSSPAWPAGLSDRGKGDGTSSTNEADAEAFESKDKEGKSKSLNFLPAGIPAAVVPSIGRCRAIYDYDANLFDELTIRMGDEINVHDKQEDGWWLGELNGVIGIFPATYVEEVIGVGVGIADP